MQKTGKKFKQGLISLWSVQARIQTRLPKQQSKRNGQKTECVGMGNGIIGKVMRVNGEGYKGGSG